MHIELWKRLLIWGIVALGFALAMPNLFYGRVERHNDAVTAIERQGDVATPEQEAQKAEWPSWLPSDIVNLGLDLRGGAHLLAEVQVEVTKFLAEVDEAVAELTQRYQGGGLRAALVASIEAAAA